MSIDNIVNKDGANYRTKTNLDQRKSEYIAMLTKRPLVLMGGADTAKYFMDKYSEKLNIKYVLTNVQEEKFIKLNDGRTIDVKQYSKSLISEEDYIIVCRQENVGEWYKNAKECLDRDGYKYGTNYISANLASAILDGKKIMTVMGWCHCKVLYDIFMRTKTIPENYFIMYYSYIWDVYESSYKYCDIFEVVKLSDILIYVPSFANNTQIFSYEDLVAADAVKFRYPDLSFKGLHPYKATNFRHENVLGIIKKEYPPRPFQYVEPVFDELVLQGKSNDEICNMVLRDDFLSEEEIRKCFKLGIKNIQINEAKSDLKISDYILENYQHDLLYRDCLHYETKMYYEICRRVVRSLQLCDEKEINEVEKFYLIEWLDITEIPILPCVAKVLDIEFATMDYKYKLRLGNDREIIMVTCREWIEAYCDCVRSIYKLKQYKIL